MSSTDSDLWDLRPPAPEPNRPARGHYRPLDRLARWVLVGFAAQAAVIVAGMAVASNLAAVSKEIERATITEGRLDVASMLATALLVITAVAVAATGLPFLVWFHRAYANLHHLQVFGLKRRRWAPVVSWFVPLAHVLWPKRVANEIWRGSQPDTVNRNVRARTAASTRLVTLWWTALLTSSFINSVLGDHSAASAEYPRVAFFIGLMLSEAISLVAIVLASLMVIRVTERQHARATLLGLVLPAPATPAHPPLAQRWGMRLAGAGLAGLMLAGATAAVAVSAGNGQPTLGELQHAAAVMEARAAAHQRAIEQDQATFAAIDQACFEFGTAVEDLAEPTSLAEVADGFSVILEETARRDAVITTATLQSGGHGDYAGRFAEPIKADSAVLQAQLPPVIEAARAGNGFQLRALLDAFPADQGTVPSAAAWAAEHGLGNCATVFAAVPQA